MIIPAGLLADIEAQASEALPLEACGLLIGRKTGLGFEVTKAVASRNLADAAHRFEIDPIVQLTWQKALRGTDEAVIGHYHSHPGGLPEPSARDVADAQDPDLLWLITAPGKTAGSRAFLIDARDGKVMQLQLNRI